MDRQTLKSSEGITYLSIFRNFHGGDSARIDIFGPFFLRLSAGGKSLEISMGETFSYLQSGLDITIKNIHFKNYYRSNFVYCRVNALLILD